MYVVKTFHRLLLRFGLFTHFMVFFTIQFNPPHFTTMICNYLFFHSFKKNVCRKFYCIGKPNQAPPNPSSNPGNIVSPVVVNTENKNSGSKRTRPKTQPTAKIPAQIQKKIRIAPTTQLANDDVDFLRSQSFLSIVQSFNFPLLDVNILVEELDQQAAHQQDLIAEILKQDW